MPQAGTPVLATPATEFGTVPAQTLACAAFNPPANSTIWVHTCGRDTAAPAAPTISDNSGGALVWTQLQNGAFNATNRMAIWYASVGAAPPTGLVITVDYGAVIASATLGVVTETGVNLINPIVPGTATGTTGTSTTPAPGTVPVMGLGNVQLLWVAERGASMTPEAGWTKLYDINSSTGNCNIAGFYTLTGDTTPTATIVSAPWRAACAELQAATVGGGLAASVRAGRRLAAVLKGRHGR